MKTKDHLMLEQVYLKILNENLGNENSPDKINPDILGSQDSDMEIEYNGNVYHVDYDADAHNQLSKGNGIHPDYNDTIVNQFTINSILVNLGGGEEDHIVDITKEKNPELYNIIFNLAKDKYEEDYSEEDGRNPNEDNPFSRDYEG